MKIDLTLTVAILAFLIAVILKKYEYKYKFIEYLFHFFLVIGFINLFKALFFR